MAGAAAVVVVTVVVKKEEEGKEYHDVRKCEERRSLVFWS